MQPHTLHYFAYGSNLCTQQMRRRCPAARPLGPARLPGHRLVFPRRSRRWGCGVAGLETAAGQCVEGAVYRVTQDCLRTLDRLEGVDAGRYRRWETKVQTLDQGSLEALTYQARVEAGGPFAPAPAYLQTMIRGARTHGLSSQWIANLDALAGATPTGSPA